MITLEKMATITLLMPAHSGQNSALFESITGSARIIASGAGTAVFLVICNREPLPGSKITGSVGHFTVKTVRTCYDLDGNIVCYRCVAEPE